MLQEKGSICLWVCAMMRLDLLAPIQSDDDRSSKHKIFIKTYADMKIWNLHPQAVNKDQILKIAGT